MFSLSQLSLSAAELKVHDRDTIHLVLDHCRRVWLEPDAAALPERVESAVIVFHELQPRFATYWQGEWGGENALNSVFRYGQHTANGLLQQDTTNNRMERLWSALSLSCIHTLTLLS